MIQCFSNRKQHI